MSTNRLRLYGPVFADGMQRAVGALIVMVANNPDDGWGRSAYHGDGNPPEFNAPVFWEACDLDTGTVYRSNGDGTWSPSGIGPDFGSAGIETDVISESTLNAGVTVEAVLIKDGSVDLIDTQTIKWGTPGTDVVLTADGTGLTVTGTGTILRADSFKDQWGTGGDLSVYHDGTDSRVDSITGKLIIDNQNVTGNTCLDLGTDTSATSIRVRNNSGATLWDLNGAGNITTRQTSTDGVASGTAMVIGGKLSSSTADSTALNQAVAGYHSFDVTYAMPANELVAGDVIDIEAVVRISTALNGGATAGAKLRLGGTDLVVAAPSTAGAANTRCRLRARLTARGAPGAAVALSGVCDAQWTDTVGTVTLAPTGAVPTFATNGALTVDVQEQTSAAGDASGRLVLESLVVRKN